VPAGADGDLPAPLQGESYAVDDVLLGLGHQHGGGGAVRRAAGVEDPAETRLLEVLVAGEVEGA
jgi:hypothetical protein